MTLASLTTLRLGGPARELVEARTEAELVDAIRRVDGPLLVLAGGSNVVIADGFVCDEQLTGAPMPVLATDVELGDARARARVAETVLDFARALR